MSDQTQEEIDLWATRARDTGAEAAIGSYADEWRRRADRVLAELASSGRTFTAEDIRHRAGDPSSPGALGALLLGASRAGMIRLEGITRSTRLQRHAGLVRVWVGSQVREVLP